MNDSILLVLPDDTLAGAEQYLQMIALYFQVQYESVHVVFLKREKQLGWSKLPENIKLYFANSSTEKAGLLHLAIHVKRLSRSYNIVHSFSSHTHINSTLGFLRKLHILKTENLIVRESTVIFQRFKGVKLFVFKLFYKLGYNYTDLVLCSNDLMRTDMLRNCPKAIKWNIKTMPNPVNIDLLHQLSNDSSYDNHYTNNEFIIAAGRLIRIKGFDILIDSFNLLIQKFSYLHLLILGDGEEKTNLQKKIFNLGLENKITLLGFVENPIPFFKKAKVCVVPSLIEGFPNVLLQMMSQNARVVSTTCAGSINEIYGLFTCNPGDVTSLAEKIEDALLLGDISQIREFFDSYLNKNSIGNYVEALFKEI